MALAQLHAILGGALKHAREPEWLECLALKRPPLGPNCQLDDARAYDWVWGPKHCILAGVLASQRTARVREPPWMARSRLARKLLIDATFLQSTIRAQAVHASKNETVAQAVALRESYMLADRLTGEDADQTLRQRVEAALLQWHSCISEETLSVGGTLWNLLGADDDCEAHSPRWKASIDRPSLITSVPGRSSEVLRRLPAKSSAVTPCGNWLVTSDGVTKCEVWDLRDGWHRAIVHFRIPWPLRSGFQVLAVSDELGIGGIDFYDSKNLFLAVVDLTRFTGSLVRFDGHTDNVMAVDLQAQVDVESQGIVRWALASGSADHTVGLLLRDTFQLERDARRRTTQSEQAVVSGALLRYSGHSRSVTSVSVQVQQEVDGNILCAVASGSEDCTVGLMLLNARHLDRDHQHAEIWPRTPIASGAMLRYAGHTRSVKSVSLQLRPVADDSVLFSIASGSEDGEVGLLVRDSLQLAHELDHATARSNEPIAPGALLRYRGHTNAVESVSLKVGRQADGSLLWAVASGSRDWSIGVLLRTAQQLRDDMGRPKAHKKLSISTGYLLRFGGHLGAIDFVSIQKEIEAGAITRLAIASKSIDGTVGLLLINASQQMQIALRSSMQPYPFVNTVQYGVLLRYLVHNRAIYRVSAHLRFLGNGSAHWALATGSEDGTVGLLPSLVQPSLQDPHSSKAPAADGHEKHALLRYRGHKGPVTSISICAKPEADSSAGWYVASGSTDGTVGLLQIDDLQCLQYAEPGSTRQFAPGSLMRYRGHSGAVNSVSLVVHQGVDHKMQFAVASASSDSTIGLLSRDARQLARDMQRVARRPSEPITPKSMVRYSGHDGAVTAVSLQIQLGMDGEADWTLATASNDRTCGLLTRSAHQFQEDMKHAATWRNGTLAPGTLLRFGRRHDWSIDFVDLLVQPRADAGDRIVLVTGSRIGLIGLLQVSSEQVEQYKASIGAQVNQPFSRADVSLFRRSLRNVRSISARAQVEADGTISCQVASAADDGSVDFFSTSQAQLLEDANTLGLSLPYSSRLNVANLLSDLIIRSVEIPLDLFDKATAGTSHWFGGNATAAVIWSTDRSADSSSLRVRHICPLGAWSGFKVMDFAQNLDRIHYMVGGAVGSDVALMSLELHVP